MRWLRTGITLAAALVLVFIRSWVPGPLLWVVGALLGLVLLSLLSEYVQLYQISALERRYHSRALGELPMTAEVPSDTDQQEGYLVLLRPDSTIERWQEDLGIPGVLQPKHHAYLSALQTALPAASQARYRGMQRYAVERGWEGQEQTRPDLRASRRLRELLGPDPTLERHQPPWFDPDLIHDLDLAKQVLELTDEPERHEIVQVTRGTPARTDQTLGFDLGYWGSDHFSLIADAMVFPRWHPAPLEALPGLARWAARLNPAVLFPSARDAASYREWYRRQPWAEHDDERERFEIVRVDEVQGAEIRGREMAAR